MADIKISALSQVSEVQSTDVVPVVSGNSTMKMTAAQVKDYCVGDLDVSDSAVASSYVTAVSETDGKISVTREAADATPTASSTKMVTSGGVYSALSGKANKATTLAGYGINDSYTATETDNAISSAINALDSSDAVVSGSYVTAVSEANGVTTVTREAADGTPTSGSSKMVTSGGIHTALSSKAEKSTISDAYNSSKAYTAGEHFIYNDVIYTVDVACTGITPPNANYYTPNNLTDLIESNSSQISNLTTSLDGKADIVGSSAWNHTATITCNIVSAGLAYLFTEHGIILLATAGGSLYPNELSMISGMYFNITGSGLTKTLTAWFDSGYTSSANTIWRLIPFYGTWTMTLS